MALTCAGTSYADLMRPGVLMIADAGADPAAAEAAALAGACLLGTVAWPALGDDMLGGVASPVLMVEAAGVDGGVLAEALPWLAGFAAALDLQVVATFVADQIDLVSAHLLGSRSQLLCQPTLPERVAALSIAAEVAANPRLEDRAREGAAQRLQRLNDEVARIAEVLSRLAGADQPREQPGGPVMDRRFGYDAGPPASEPVSSAAIRKVIRRRRLRDQYFGDGWFEDPAWDMLLDLYAAELERTRVSVSSLCIAAAVAPTTALRWISRMSDAGLLQREPDPEDRRRAFLRLSPGAGAGMREYFTAIGRDGAAIE